MIREVFEFLEIVAEELSTSNTAIITAASISGKGTSTLLVQLRKMFKAPTDNDAISAAVAALQTHFEGKDAQLPFDYDAPTAKFTARDTDFLKFITDMKSIRTLGKHSNTFERSVATRLKLRATGAIHRVGHPRDVKKSKAAFNDHLKKLGFARPVLLGKEKDGGLDIIWQLPIGTIPHRPFVSIQCKNSKFDPQVANESTGSASQSLAMHEGLQPFIHVPCVFFNDYLDPTILGRKPLQYVALGLTDLAALSTPVTIELI